MEHAVTGTKDIKHKGINTVEGKNGKTRYQAVVWYDRKFIISKTFDSLSLAKKFRENKLEEAVQRTLQPAAERRKQRELEADLNRTMLDWSAKYIEANTAGHGDNRLYEYDQVGRLLGRRTLQDFSGKAGGQLILQLGAQWRFIRFTRGTRGEPIHTPGDPISDQTLRLRLSALDRLIAFAAEQLPDGVEYVGPKKPKDYAPPPAHGNKRTRLPTVEEFTALVRHVGPASDFADFLQVVDETGCRLSEVSLACGNQLTFFGVGGQVLGGVLTLHRHKTSARVGTRQVPLSRHAALVLHARKAKFGDGTLFPGLPGSNDICKDFDDACTALRIDDLQIKDFRRAFITRNVRAVSSLELVSVVGQSSLIDLKNLSPEERRTQNAVGHTDARTTLGYVTPEHQAMAQAFTATSRWPAVARVLQSKPGVPIVTPAPQGAFERELADLMARMRSQGMVLPAV